MRPTAADAYPAATSRRLAVEQGRDVRGAHGVEVVGNRNLALHEADTPFAACWRLIQRSPLDQGLPGFGGHGRFPPHGRLDQTRKMWLGFVDVDRAHDC